MLTSAGNLTAGIPGSYSMTRYPNSKYQQTCCRSVRMTEKKIAWLIETGNLIMILKK